MIRPSMGRGSIFRHGPLVVFADEQCGSARLGDLVCYLDGWLSPASGHPASREHRHTADADTLVQAYRQSGGPGVSALRGQFTALVWDSRRSRLRLICDLLARQGWYVLERSGEILFATELRELLRLAPSRPDTDTLSFTMWLGGEGCPEGRTLYAGISRLGPGESFEYASGGLDRQVHWRPTYRPTLRSSRWELAEQLRQQLQEATWQYLSPGVNGIILSGGIDSSVVAAVAAEGQADGIDVRTYSAIFPGAPYDESGKIKALTDALGVRARATRPVPVGALWLALRHLEQWGIPLVAPGAVLEMAVAAMAAADGAGTVLDGQTGDEILGFAPFLLADRLVQGRLLSARRLLRRWPAGRATSFRERARLAQVFGVKGAVPYRVAHFVRDHRDRTGHGPKWLAPARRRVFIEFEDAWAWKTRNSGPRWWRSFIDTVVWGPHRELRLEYLRHRAGNAGMRWGSPLYDHGLIEFCARIDPEISFDAQLNRPLVREALSDLLPEAVRLQRRKANFSAFAVESMVADAAGFECLLGAANLEIASYVDVSWLRSRWRGGDPLPPPQSTFWGALWRTAVGQAWLQFGEDPESLSGLVLDPGVSPPPRASTAPLMAD